jgi:hypothetical protein
MWQRWQPSAAIDNDDALRQHHHDAIEHTAAFADGEKHQPHRRQPIHASGPSAGGANGSAGPTSWHQWHPLNIGFRHFCLSWCGPIAGSVAATLVQMATALAAPWPLKSILDNVVGNRPAPLRISWLLPFLGGTGTVQITAAAGILTVLIAVVAGRPAKWSCVNHI